MSKLDALDPADGRSARLRVAGIAALLVAKTHKLSDRVDAGRQDRVDDKDAADVVRLMQTSSPVEVAGTLSRLLDHASAGTPTDLSIQRFGALFGNRAGTGIEMAARALRTAMPSERVRSICLAYSGELYSSLRANGIDPSPKPGQPL